MRREAEYPRAPTKLMNQDGTPTREFANFLELLANNVKIDTPFMTGNSGSGVAAGQTRYVGLASINATEANVQIVVPKAGTWRNLYVYVVTAAGAGQTFTFTFRNGNADTDITCTISGASAVSASDTTHVAEADAGDTFSLKVVASGASAGSGVITWAIEFVPAS